MNIVINAVLAFEEARGVGRYFNNLLPEIAKNDKKNQYYIYYGKWMKKYSFLKVEQENIHFICLDIKNNQIYRNLYLAIILPLKSKKYKPDVYFLIDTQATLLKPCKILSTIHDLAEYQVPEKYSKKQAYIRRRIVKRQIKLSDQIITVSDYSKNDICRRFGVSKDKIHVIYNSLAKSQQNMEVFNEPENYFLFVSEIEKAKNLEVLIRAFSLLDEKYKEKFKIEVVGKHGNDYDRLQTIIANNNLQDKVHFNGFVSDEKLKEMYAKAYAFVFPSFFEGFGLPVIEAMGNNTPVICSDITSIPEVGGEAVLTFNPYKAEELKDKMEYLIQNKSVRKDMILKGQVRLQEFEPSKLIREFMNVLNLF